MKKTVKSIRYAVAPLHNVRLPQNTNVLRLDQYRIVRVRPRDHLDGDVPGDVFAAMRRDPALADWTSVLKEGHFALTENTPKYVAYFFPKAGDSTSWLGGEQSFDDVAKVFATLRCALAMHKSSYVSTPGSLIKGISMYEGALATIYQGRQALARTPNVPMMYNPRYLLEGETVYVLSRRDVTSMEVMIRDVRRAMKGRLRMAFDRFLSSMDKPQADRLVDLLVATEVMFGDGDRSAVGHKIALRAALVCGTGERTRLRVFELLKNAYNKRSSLLHGRAKDVVWANENVNKVNDVVRKSLKWLVAEARRTGRCPEAKDVDRMSFRSVPRQV